MLRIKITRPDQPPRTELVPGPSAIIGRSPECDVVIEHPYVSKRHLRIHHGVVAEDLGSSNGSFLDGEPIDEPHVIGDHRLTVGEGVVLDIQEELPAEDSAILRTNRELERRIEELEAELAQRPARPAAETGESGPGAGAPHPRADFAPDSGPGGAPDAIARLRAVVESEAEEAPLLEAPPEQFFIVESFKLLRQIEYVVTQVACELQGDPGRKDTLPGSDGNLRRITAALMDAPRARAPRDDLVAYMDSLRKWLFVALGAYRKASIAFAVELTGRLTRDELCAKRRVSRWARVSGRMEAELWKRSREYLDGLTPEFLEERLDQLASEAARMLQGFSERRR